MASSNLLHTVTLLIEVVLGWFESSVETKR